MKNHLIRTFAIFLILSLAAVFAVAQNDTLSAAAGDRYVVSARAGGVNYVEGTVAVVRASGTSGLLLKGDTLEVGDRVSTAANGRAEILLNPGSFLRLAGNSAFEFKTTSLDDLQLRIDSGTAILEVFAANEFKVNVKTPSATYSLIKSGVFRIDIPNASTSTLAVWKGMATVGTEDPVKAGRAVTVSGRSEVAVSKFDKDGKDAFDEWSKSRSKALAQQTAGLRRRDISTPLMQGFLGGRWNFFNTFGLWIYSPFTGGYSFLPFGYAWSSPYGYGYGNGMAWWWEQMHFPTYLPPVPSGTSTGTGSTTSSNSDRTLASTRNQGRLDNHVPNDTMRPPTIPPFIRMEQMNGGGMRGRMDRGDDASSSGAGGYTPSYPSSGAAPSAAPSSGGAATSVPGKANPGLKP